jgi:hypothetical protein
MLVGVTLIAECIILSKVARAAHRQQSCGKLSRECLEQVSPVWLGAVLWRQKNRFAPDSCFNSQNTVWRPDACWRVPVCSTSLSHSSLQLHTAPDGLNLIDISCMTEVLIRVRKCCSRRSQHLLMHSLSTSFPCLRCFILSFYTSLYPSDVTPTKFTSALHWEYIRSSIAIRSTDIVEKIHSVACSCMYGLPFHFTDFTNCGAQCTVIWEFCGMYEDSDFSRDSESSRDGR